MATEGGITVRQKDGENAPDTHDTVDRDGAYGVINLQAIKADDREHHQHPTDQTHKHGKLCTRAERVRGNGHKPRKRSVKGHGEIGLAKEGTGRQECSHHTTASREVGIYEHLSHGVCFINIGELELRAAIEAEPAKPQDECTQRCQRHIGPWDSARASIVPVFPSSRSKDKNARQGRSSAAHVHRAGTREIKVASGSKGTPAPIPSPLDRVDEASHHHRKGQESPELHALCHCAGHNGHGRSHEDDLEEVIRTCRVVGVPAGGQNVRRRVFFAYPHAEAWDPRPFCDVAVHQRVPEEQIHDASNGKKRNVLGQDFRRVFRTNEPRLEHGKARGHEHNQRAHDEKVKGIN